MSAIDATIFDHVLLLLLLVALPAGGWYSIQRVRRQLAAGIPYTSRITDYRNNMLIMWGVTFAALAAWFYLGRDWAIIGLLLPGGGYGLMGLALLLCVALVGMSAYSEIQVRNSDSVARTFVDVSRGSKAPNHPDTANMRRPWKNRTRARVRQACFSELQH